MVRIITFSIFLLAAAIPAAAQDSTYDQICRQYDALQCTVRLIEYELAAQALIRYDDGRHAVTVAADGTAAPDAGQVHHKKTTALHLETVLESVRQQRVSMNGPSLIYSSIEELDCTPEACEAKSTCDPQTDATTCISIPLRQLRPENVYVQEILATWCAGATYTATCHETETSPATYAIKINEPASDPIARDPSAPRPMGVRPPRIVGIFTNRETAYRVARYYRRLIELFQPVASPIGDFVP